MDLKQFSKGKLLKNGEIYTPWFRGSFISVWSTESYKGKDTGKYAVTMLFDPKQVDMAPIYEAAKRIGQEKFGDSLERYSKSASWKPAFKKGDDFIGYDGYEGMVVVKATTRYAIQVVGPRRESIHAPGALEADPCYSGAYYRAVISPWAYDNESRGIAWNISILQKIADGEKFGGGSADLDELEDVETETNFDDIPF